MALWAFNETERDVTRQGSGFHLHLFLHGEPANPVPFGARQELFARFWKAKRQKANHQGADFERVVGTLADELSRTESISAPASRLDAVARDADMLVSDNVLVLENGRYRFFHESFFDYAFARRFVNEGRDLIRFLTQDSATINQFVSGVSPFFKNGAGSVAGSKSESPIKSRVGAGLRV